MLRTRPARGAALLLLLALLMAFSVAAPRPASATAGDIGYQDGSTGTAGGAASGEKPENKLWWNDGSWWGSLFNSVSGRYDIFRLDRGTQTWVDTGVPLDNRPSSRADATWDGSHLYISSHVFASSSTSYSTNQPTRLYRFSYNASSKSYTLDAGFPAKINNISSESLTMDKDSTGRLWAAWTQDKTVYVNATSGSDASWGQPFALPVSGASGLTYDDIASVVSFGGRIGVMWSNQSTSTMSFAVHADGAANAAWNLETAVSGPNWADDHINLKALDGDSSGRVFASVKTSLDATGSSTAPQVILLARNPSNGQWSYAVYGTVADCHTRPVLLLDSQHSTVYVFATAPTSGGCPFAGTPGTIYMKSSPMGSLSFPSGRGTPVIRDAASASMNNATTTKQSVNGTTGMVVLATNSSTNRYWHADLALTAPTAPTASYSVSANSGPAPLTVNFTDTSIGTPTSWAWTFGDGGASTSRSPSHIYGSAGTYPVSLTASNAVGSNTATSTITVTSAGGGGIATIAAAGSSTGGNASAVNSVTLTKPTGTSTGDLLVAGMTVDNSPTISAAPDGWTQLMPAVKPVSGASLYVYYHVVTSAEATATSWSWALSSAQKWGGGVTRYTGVDPTNPWAVSPVVTVKSAQVTSITSPGLTTSTAGDMIVGGLGADGTAISVSSAPAGFAEGWQMSTGQLTEQASKLQPTAGATGSLTWSLSGARSLAVWVAALRPAAA